MKDSDNIQIQVEPTHYEKNYDAEEHFISYWHQIQEVVELEPKSVLEIGIGNDLVSDWLKKRV